MLTAEGITKTYGDLVALDHVEVSVHPGRITVLIGPSGSGKTTLLRSLALLDPPDSGVVSIDGADFSFPSRRRRPPAAPWPKVTLVFQQLFLWPHLTLKENILLPLRSRGGDLRKLGQMVALFGMSGFIDRYPNEVSIGQRQRAALARAMALDPSYILLDEITSALDTEQTGIIMNYLLSVRDQGIGILLVTHLIGFARRLLERRQGDQVMFLDNGRLLESGDIEVLAHPRHPRFQSFLETSRSVI